MLRKLWIKLTTESLFKHGDYVTKRMENVQELLWTMELLPMVSTGFWRKDNQMNDILEIQQYH